MKKILLVLLIFLTTLSCANYNEDFRYRKYTHVKKFYKPLIKPTIDIGLKYNVPPAAILAIASIESGYGRGYVGKITGNILSLGANKGEKELPSVYLPHDIKSKEVIYNQKKIKAYDESQLKWKQRPKSLKKDYRPNVIAGTSKELDYFDYHEDARLKANLKNFEEFASKWISYSKRQQPFKNARAYLDEQVKKMGVKALFDQEVNKTFIEHIGGKPYSFNYRETWPIKVKQVMKNSGLVKLTQDIYDQKAFKEVW